MFLIFFLLILTSNAQFHCGTIMNSVPPLGNANNRIADPITNWAEFVPNQNTPNRILRINFHYLLRDNGSGNFTETTDGRGSSNFNGYRYIYELLLPSIYENIDNKQAYNVQLGTQSNNLPYRINVVVDGIYFHRNTSVYDFYNTTCDVTTCNTVLNSLADNTFNVNATTSVNVYLIESGRLRAGAGVAWQTTTAKSFHLFGSWRSYADQSAWWQYDLNAKTFLHELGHCLSLNHLPGASNVKGPNLGATCNYDDDCSDTPTSICGAIWNCNTNTCSNNLMSYNNGNALSPCQLGRIHWTIENEIASNKLCNYSNQTAEFNNLGYPQILYQARTLSIGNTSGQSVLLPGEKAVFVGENSVELRAGFEAQLGSEFEIRIEPSCN